MPRKPLFRNDDLDAQVVADAGGCSWMFIWMEPSRHVDDHLVRAGELRADGGRKAVFAVPSPPEDSAACRLNL